MTRLEDTRDYYRTDAEAVEFILKEGIQHDFDEPCGKGYTESCGCAVIHFKIYRCIVHYTKDQAIKTQLTKRRERS